MFATKGLKAPQKGTDLKSFFPTFNVVRRIVPSLARNESSLNDKLREDEPYNFEPEKNYKGKRRF